jgi:hypothetical protein
MKTLKGPAIFLAAFNDFAGAGTDEAANRRMLGIKS